MLPSSKSRPGFLCISVLLNFYLSIFLCFCISRHPPGAANKNRTASICSANHKKKVLQVPAQGTNNFAGIICSVIAAT